MWIRPWTGWIFSCNDKVTHKTWFTISRVVHISGDDIKFGATIEIEDDDTGTKQKYQIVGEYESDIENKKLSINSPLARGLIGKSKDDNVEINSPKGIKSYTIISVKYI